MYAAFIDFRKAFDSVKRETLWPKNGINGKMLMMIESIYNIVLSCVRCPYGKTIFFDCPNGVRQGFILSPVLFSLLVQEITNEIHRRGGYRIQLVPDLVEVDNMLLADDIVLIVDSVFELQKKLDISYEVAVKLGLVITMAKSKVVVFRKGGHLACHDMWHIGNTSLEVVSEYSYLIFSTKLKNNVILSRLATKLKIAFCIISSLLNRMNTTSYNILCKMSDAQVQPILLYGSELWGLNVTSTIENVHFFSLKKMLQVPISTP